MSSFASTGLTWLAVRALRAIDPALLPPGVRTPDDFAHATLPAAEKRSILEYAYRRGGAGPLITVGRSLDAIAAAPVIQALLASADPDVLADKWMRLEQYQHSKHRTAITSTVGRWDCIRYSTDGTTPAAPENLLIFGVCFGILDLFGCAGVLGRMDGAEDDERELIARDLPIQPEVTDRWTITWRPPPTSRLADMEEDDPGAPASDRVIRLLSDDMGRNWKLTVAARFLGRSARSLQRDLEREGRTFSSVVREARSRKAARLLRETDWALCDVGYWCGYADQAHFQRDFRRAVNMTPAAYRRLSSDRVRGA